MNKLGRYNERRAWFCRLEYYLNVNFVAEQTGCGIEPHLAYPTVQKFMSFRVCVCVRVFVVCSATTLASVFINTL